jgi:hypothetical protein
VNPQISLNLTRETNPSIRVINQQKREVTTQSATEAIFQFFVLSGSKNFNTSKSRLATLEVYRHRIFMI